MWFLLRQFHSGQGQSAAAIHKWRTTCSVWTTVADGTLCVDDYGRCELSGD